MVVRIGTGENGMGRSKTAATSYLPKIGSGHHPHQRHVLRMLSYLLIFDLAYLINAMDRQIIPILIRPISTDLQLNPSQFGLVSTVFTLGMGLTAYPSGYIADRFGRKAVIQAGLLLFSLATALQGLAFGFADLTCYRILSGVGEGAQNAALYAAVGSYFGSKRASAVGTLNASYGIGAFAGPVLGNYLYHYTNSWRIPLLIFAGMGAIVSALILLGIPKQASDKGKTATTAAGETDSKLLNRNIVMCMIVAAVSGFAIYGFLGLYPTFLQLKQGFNADQASLISGMFGLGALASIPVGFVADRWNQKVLNLMGLSGLMIIGVLIFTIDLDSFGNSTLTALLGTCFTGILYTNTNTLMQRSVPPARVGGAVGLFVAALYIPASVAGLVFGLAETRWGWSNAAVIQMALIPSAGLIAMLLMKLPPIQQKPLPDGGTSIRRQRSD